MDRVKVLDKEFKLAISAEQIENALDDLASRMNQDLRDKKVLFLGILNGSFVFAADLFRKINFDCQITFLKLASYQGTSSSGKIKRLIGMNEDIKDHTIIILEDIVDTGHTLDNIIKQLKGYEPAEIKIATLLYKPDAFQHDIKLDYVGLEIPNDFIIGYGLDYNGYGRNLKQIYSIIES
jgi:hypoxanthine phosphoribosyltransferase